VLFNLPVEHEDIMARLVVVNVDDLILTRLAMLLETDDHQLITTYSDNQINQLPIVVDADVIVGVIDKREHLLQFHLQKPRTPVIAVTDSPSVEEAVQFMQVGAYEYVATDSLTSLKLMQMIDAALAARELWVQQFLRLEQAAQMIANVLEDVKSEPEVFLSVGRSFVNEDDYPLQIGELTLIPEEDAVLFHDQRSELSPTEYRILVELIRNVSHVVTFEELALKLRGIPIPRNQARRMFSAHISNLRKKLELIDCHYVVNKRGEGYYLDINYEEQPTWGFRQLKWIIDHALDAILLVDARAKFNYVSPSIRSLLGYEPEHFTAQPIVNLSHIFHQDDRPALLAWIENPKSYPLNAPIWRVRHQNGEYIWVEVQVNAMLDENDKLFSAVMFWRDVSQRKVSETFLESIVNNVSLFIARFDADLRCVFLNPLAATFKLGDGQLAIGEYLSASSLPSDLSKKWQDSLQTVLYNGEQQHLMLLNGAEALDMRLIPELDANGQVTHVVCIAGGVASNAK